jgi:hypothetical protein
MKLDFKLLSVVLVIGIILLAAVSAVLLSSNSTMNSENAAQATKLQMQSTLGRAQMAVQTELMKVKGAMANASQSLAASGLIGVMARINVNNTVNSNPYFINAFTFDPYGVIHLPMPLAYQYMSGKNISTAAFVQQLISTKMPVMTDVITTEGVIGAVFTAPVFSSEGLFIGGVSGTFNASAMMNAVLPPLTAGTQFSFWSMQKDGIVVYDTDESQIGTNVLTMDYADYPALQVLVWKIRNETTGYGAYSYVASHHSQNTASKQCFWATVGSEGIAWRIVLVQQ